MIAFPNLKPDIFSISLFGFEFSLRWYAVSYILGFIAAILIMKFFIRRRALWNKSSPPMDEPQADALLTYLIIGVIVGGRLGYVCFYNLNFYLSEPLAILRVWDGGMSFHGGFVGVVFATIIYCIKHRISLFSTADIIAVASPPGLLFGRIANFINAELWGRPTDLPWGVVFPGSSAQNCGNIIGPCARHPTQLYEAGAEGLLLFVLLCVFAFLGYLKKPGFLTGSFLLGYGFARFLIEYYRVPDPQFFSTENTYGYALRYGEFGMSMGQVLSLPMILCGLVLMIIALSFHPSKKG